MEDYVSACTDVSTDSTGLHRIMCMCIYTKGTGVHVVTSTDKFKAKTCVRGIMNAYDKYRRYKPIRDICTDVVGNV